MVIATPTLDEPLSLHERALSVVCDDLVAVTKTGGAPHRPPDLMPSDIADALLAHLSSSGRLTAETLRWFDRTRCRLRHVCLRDCFLDNVDIKFLLGHDILSLRLVDVDGFQLRYVVENYLSSQSRKHLQLLDLTGMDAARLVRREDNTHAVVTDIAPAIIGLSNLKSLNLSRTPLEDDGLSSICQHLRHLESLDLSQTSVKDVSSLIMLKDTLHHLYLYSVEPARPSAAAKCLLQLDCLETLDISSQPTQSAHNNLGALFLERAAKHAAQPSTSSSCRLQRLRILDVAGTQANIDTNYFAAFVRAHSSLEFVGLLLTNACYFDGCVADAEVADREYQFQVAGEATLPQLSLALDTYRHRHTLATKCLTFLFPHLTTNINLNDPAVCNMWLKKIITIMTLHTRVRQVQLAASACLHAFSREKRPTHVIHPNLLRAMVRALLSALRAHPSPHDKQLHKNVWLTLCVDAVLQSEVIDHYDCCVTALNSMIVLHDDAVNRMVLAILAYLVSKLPIPQTIALGTDHRYMRYLLDLLTVNTELCKVECTEHSVDRPMSTLRFALSALWNLTDESPPTCRAFVEEYGVDCAIEILQVFDSTEVRTKVLGLLNNVAEVPIVRERLVTPVLIEKLIDLLRGSEIHVSYFAGGILSHLAADARCKKRWPLEEQCCHHACLEILFDTVSGWEPPTREMVSYRSFRPFFDLLARSSPRGVQLWAVWAIWHVCSCAKTKQRYIDYFTAESGFAVFRRLLSCPSVDARVKMFAANVMELLCDLSESVTV